MCCSTGACRLATYHLISSSDLCQPPSLEFFGNMLSFRDERSILNLIEAKTLAEDNGRQTQVDYVQGLVGIAVCFVSFWVLWLIILAVLNCAGERVGCASGRPFRSSQLFLREDKKSKTREGRLDYSSWRRDNQRILASRGRTASQPRIDYLDGLWRYETSGSIGDQHEQQGEDEFEDEIFSTLSGASTKSSWTHRMRSACCSDSREQVERRKRRTRVAYCVAFLVVELTGILLFVYLCYPMVGISTNAWSLIEEGRDVRSQVDQSLNEIRAAVEIVDGLIKKTPRDPLLICPRDTEMDAASLMIGNDFQTVLGLLASDYPDVLKTAQADLDAASSITDTLDHVLSKSTAILEESESRLWILPFIVLSSMIVNWIFGMVFAMTAFATPRNEDQKEEKPRWKYKTAFLLNRILLPVAILLATLAFFLSTALLVSGAMASDSCIAGEDQSPDATIEAIISQQQFAHNLDDFTARTLKAYTVEVSATLLSSCFRP